MRASNGATGLVADYGYGPKGRRVLKSVRSSAQASAVVTEYLYEGDEPIADYDGIGNVLRRYAHGANVDERLVYRSYDARTGALTDELYYRANHQGSIIAMADAAAARTAVYSYDAYGTPGEAEDGQPFRYTGRRYDPETGLYYYRARYYSATLGRFLQTDPIGYEDNMNMYAYTNNDPVNLTDPSGKCPWCIGALIGGGLNLAVQLYKNGGDLSKVDVKQVAIAAAAGAVGVNLGVAVAETAALYGLSGASALAANVAGNTVAGAAITTVSTIVNADQNLTGDQLVDAAKNGGAFGAAGTVGGTGLGKALQKSPLAGDPGTLNATGRVVVETLETVVGNSGDVVDATQPCTSSDEEKGC